LAWNENEMKIGLSHYLMIAALLGGSRMVAREAVE
jgi:hypothetical protein